MDDKKLLEKLDKKVDILDEKFDAMNLNLAVYNEQLKIHIEGTVQNRQSIDSINKKLEPLQNKSLMVDGALKLIGGLAVLVGIAAGIKDLLF